MKTTRRWLSVAALAALLPLASCKNFLDVESPGRIPDKSLDNPDPHNIASLVTGMSYNVARAMNNSAEALSMAAGELWHGGSYNWGDVPRGIITPEDVNGTWSAMMQAQWVAESGIERIKSVLPAADFNASAQVARAYLLAGFANRLIGENTCLTVINGGAPQPNDVEFDRGIDNFTQAIAIGTTAKATDIVNAAYGGRASLKAWKGDWAGAVADAQKVPPEFVYYAVLMTEGLQNTLAYETHDRFEYTVFSTEFATRSKTDPRAPWDTVKLASGRVATGANGSTPMFQQRKYNNLGDDMPLVKGTEMLVLRAEAALRNNDIPGAYALLNQARAVYKMPALTPAADLATAWRTLEAERGATVWLENRRLWDLRRWYKETGPAHNDFLNGRDKAIPISEDERKSNKNVPADLAPRCQ